MQLASLGPSRPPDICSKLELIRPSKTNTAAHLSLEPSSMAKLSYGSLQDRGDQRSRELCTKYPTKRSSCLVIGDSAPYGSAR
jgi:hypothetical protein